jgi:hypothetical protein
MRCRQGSFAVKKIYAIAALAISGAGVTSLANAALLSNGGFESGLSEWLVGESGSVFVLPSTPEIVSPFGPPVTPGTILPTEGGSFAYMLSRGRSDTSSGTLGVTSLSHGVNLAAGDVLSFDVFFDAGDYTPPGNDLATASIIFFGPITCSNNNYGPISIPCPTGSGFHSVSLWQMAVDDVGSYGASGWTHVALTIPGAISGALDFTIGNVADGNNPSALAIDNVGINMPPPNPVPLPAAAYLLIAGLGGLVPFSRRRRKGLERVGD